MQKIKEAASEFLANKRVAVTGVSRHAKDHGSNVVYKPDLRPRRYCDSSPNRHARAHAHAIGHPVVRSFEPGEEWRWCYVDEMFV